jgi:hypothetical protein
MSNNNGLLCSTDVCTTALQSSSYFIKKGEVIVAPSPLQIISPDGTNVASLSESNTGNLFIESGAGDMLLYPGTGLLKLLSPNAFEETIISTANDGTATVSTSQGPLVLSSQDNTIVVTAQSSETTGLQLAPANETTGVGGLVIRNGFSSADPSRFAFFNSSVTGGGLTQGFLDLYGYSSSGPTIIRRLMNISPLGNSIVLGDINVVGGAVVGIAGPSGIARVFDPVYNPVTLQDVLTANNSAGLSQINMNSQKIVGVLNPTNAQDAATKNYVDTFDKVIYNAQNSTSITKGAIVARPDSSAGLINRVLYTTSGDPNNAQITLPSPGILNNTFGFVFSNVGGANTDDLDIVLGDGSPIPPVILTVVPNDVAFANKLVWFVNIAPDTYQALL